MPTSAAAPLLVFGGCIEKGVCVEISPKDAWVYASIFRIPNPFRNRCQVPLPSPFARFPILRSLVCRENSRNALQRKHLVRKRRSSSAAGRGSPLGFKLYEAGKDIMPVEAVADFSGEKLLKKPFRGRLRVNFCTRTACTPSPVGQQPTSRAIKGCLSRISLACSRGSHSDASLDTVVI
jgi:hypothetical protein